MHTTTVKATLGKATLEQLATTEMVHPCFSCIFADGELMNVEDALFRICSSVNTSARAVLSTVTMVGGTFACGMQLWQEAAALECLT